MKTLVLKNTTLAYRDEGAGKTLLFVHGFPLNGSGWDKQISKFKSTHRVVVPDLRGFGESPAVKEKAYMSDFADDLKDLIEKLAVGPVILVGHSMGGYIALNFAQRFSSLVRGLVLVGSRSTADTAEASEKRRATAKKVLSEGPDFLLEEMARKIVLNEALVPEVKKRMRPVQSEGIVAALLGMAERADTTAELSKMNFPALVISGTEDTLIPKEESEKMAAKLPKSQLVLIAGAAHWVPVEKPEEFNKVLTAWLSQFSGDVS